jgi:arsenical pump membrane protein
VAALATAGVILRPWRLPEAIWAVLGAAALVGGGLLPVRAAWQAIGRGADVYLFLTGMMLLSEIARREGLFDWLAALAVRHARGSARRLFLLIYAVGTVVTVFMSNDATAVVLTPAVFAAARAARAEPLPYLFICACIANAASFVLPISNPANLVLYGRHMPPLLAWLSHFALASAGAILATYVALRITQRAALRAPLAREVALAPLSGGGRAAAAGIAATAGLLLLVSGFRLPLGLPTCIAGAMTAGVVLIGRRAAPWPVLGAIAWSVLPLVAGLFVLVAGVAQSGMLGLLADTLHRAAQASVAGTAWGSGIGLALLCNAMNNLPAGLIASSVITAGDLPQRVTDALLVGVDLGPNLSITGSLATILWLTALRREGVSVSFGQFLRVGAVVMPPALLLALLLTIG